MTDTLTVRLSLTFALVEDRSWFSLERDVQLHFLPQPGMTVEFGGDHGNGECRRISSVTLRENTPVVFAGVVSRDLTRQEWDEDWPRMQQRGWKMISGEDSKERR